jgi:hypothetical protein
MPKIYKKTLILSEQISDSAWYLVQFWSVFSKNLIGNNLITSLDKVSIDLQFYNKTKDKQIKQDFLYKSQKKLFEAFMWLDKARRRKIISKDDYQMLYTKMTILQEVLNS